MSSDSFLSLAPNLKQKSIQVDYKNAVEAIVKAILLNLRPSDQSNTFCFFRAIKIFPLILLASSFSVLTIGLYTLFQTASYVVLRDASFKSFMNGIYQEAFALYLISISYHFKITDPVSKNSHKIPMLCVHGLMHDSSAWHYYSNELKAEVGPIHTIDLGSPFKSIESYVELIHQKVLKIQAETGCKDIMLVGHSMGGLVISSFAEKYHDGQNCNIKAIITLGSPFQGTMLAKPIKVSSCVQQMRPDSDFVKKLKKDFIRSTIPTRHIASCLDAVVPFKSALPSKDFNAAYTSIVDGGHCALLFSKTIKNEIKETYMQISSQ